MFRRFAALQCFGCSLYAPRTYTQRAAETVLESTPPRGRVDLGVRVEGDVYGAANTIQVAVNISHSSRYVLVGAGLHNRWKCALHAPVCTQ